MPSNLFGGHTLTSTRTCVNIVHLAVDLIRRTGISVGSHRSFPMTPWSSRCATRKVLNAPDLSDGPHW
jgi:hypothetical protein